MHAHVLHPVLLRVSILLIIRIRILPPIRIHTHACERKRPHTLAYVLYYAYVFTSRTHAFDYFACIQHASAYVRISQRTERWAFGDVDDWWNIYASIGQHASAYVRIRQHTSAYVSICQHASENASIRQHTSVNRKVGLGM